MSTRGRLNAHFGADHTHSTNCESKNLAATLFDGEWHHIAAVLDRNRNGEVRLYLDGVEVTQKRGQLTLPIQFGSGGMSVALGAGSPSGIGRKGAGYRGGIDEVRISSTVRPAFEVGPNEPPPPPLPKRVIPPEARLTPDHAASLVPLTLSPENTVIAVAAELPSVNDYSAARLFQKWLRRASGVKEGYTFIDQNRPDDLVEKQVLVLGASEWLPVDEIADLEPSGYVIRRKGKVINIAGKHPDASVWGVVGFLDRYVGVRFYMPGDLFTTVPQPGREIVLRKVDVTVVPYVQAGAAHTWGAPDGHKWGQYHAMFRRPDSHQHNMFARFPPHVFAEKYPEIYPIINGKRHIPGRHGQKWQPCFSEPKLVDAAVESANDHFTRRPDLPYIAFGIQDGHVFCDRDLSSEEVKQHGKVQGLSNLYWSWLNDVATRLEVDYPDKKIVGLVYSDVRMPPPFKLHKNIVAWMVFKMSDIVIDKRFTTRKIAGRQRPWNYEKAWAEAAHAVGHHDWAYGLGYLIPRIYSHYEQRTFLEMEKMGVPIRYAYSELGVNWGLDGPKAYLLAKLWQDPRIDLDAELRRFCDDLFGAASEPMYQYFTLLETLYCEHLNRRTEQKLYRWNRQFKGWTAEERGMLVRARGHLEQASELAAADELAKQRIDLFSRTLRLTEYLVEIGNAAVPAQAKIAEAQEYVKEAIAPDLMTVARRGKEEAAVKLVDGVLKQITRR